MISIFLHFPAGCVEIYNQSMINFSKVQGSDTVLGLNYKKILLALIIVSLVPLLLSGISAATVKASSVLSVARLQKSGDDMLIVHNAGFSFSIPAGVDVVIYESKDAFGLRKLYLQSSKGPKLEISSFSIDSMEPGVLDQISLSFLMQGNVTVADRADIRVSGLEGFYFSVPGKATAASVSASLMLYAVLTDYGKGISIVAYTQDSGRKDAEELIGLLLTSLKLNESWSKTTE
jgi:hypothetical protein